MTLNLSPSLRQLHLAPLPFFNLIRPINLHHVYLRAAQVPPGRMYARVSEQDDDPTDSIQLMEKSLVDTDNEVAQIMVREPRYFPLHV